MLEKLEEVILDNRDKISYPPYKEHVVFLVSGGLDSTIGVAQVIDKYDCIVHPLFIKRHSKNMIYEENSIKEIYSELEKRYPNNLNKVETVDIEIPPLKFKKGLKEERLNTTGHALRNVSLVSIGAQYAVFLNDTMGLNIRTLFVGSIEEDSFPHNKLEAYRLMTLALCWDLNDFNWQVISPFIEPEFDTIPQSKNENIRWAMDKDLPLNKTRTCTLLNKKACGKCSDCLKRKVAFEMAGFEDPALFT